jgi:hypothetical protein
MAGMAHGWRNPGSVSLSARAVRVILLILTVQPVPITPAGNSAQSGARRDDICNRVDIIALILPLFSRADNPAVQQS